MISSNTRRSPSRWLTQRPDGSVISTIDQVSWENRLTVSGGGRGDKHTPTAFSFNRVRTDFPSGSTRYFGPSGSMQQYSSGSNSSSFRVIVPDRAPVWNSLENQALGKMYGRMRDSDINVAVTIGEIKETSVMVVKALDAMNVATRMLRDVRRNPLRYLSARQKRTVAHTPSAVFSSAWLNVKYGWMPAYQDVYSLSKYATSKASGIRHAYGAKTFRSDILTKVNEGDGYPTWTVTGYQSYRVKYGMAYQVSSPMLYELSRVTSLDPTRIAWELAPLSFVVDWFFDIGGYLELSEASLMRGLQFLFGFKTRTFRCETTQVAVNRSNRYWWSPEGTQYSLRATRLESELQRSVLKTPPRPSYPTCNLSLGSQRVLSAAALMRTILPGSNSLSGVINALKR